MQKNQLLQINKNENENCRFNLHGNFQLLEKRCTDLLFSIDQNENKNRPFWWHFASKTINILEKAFLTEIKN